MFEIRCVLGKKVRLTQRRWELIINHKHPAMKDKKENVKEALILPDEVRQSKKDAHVRLYYKKLEDKFVCVVIKVLNGDGFVITCYVTDKMKEGNVLWKK